MVKFLKNYGVYLLEFMVFRFNQKNNVGLIMIWRSKNV